MSSSQLPPPPAPFTPSSSSHHTQQPSQFPATTSHKDLWQATSQKLSNIEAAVAGEETSVFGPDHAKALEELRTAQVQLAQAWMRSECEDLLDGEHAELARRSFGRDGMFGAGEPGGAGPSGSGGAGDIGGFGEGSNAGGDGIGTTEATGIGSERGGEQAFSGGAPSATQAHPGAGAFSIGSGSIRRESGMGKDTLLARQRRELNDAHFNRVSLSVMDVIQKLENVAAAMAVVETESREIWGGEMSESSSIK
ncbi:hypothetical protein BDZ91DRAFT_711990 [Kalaharituber pfeilii]|nr:hypothetical protein BDZ91DRAFT_711990 [Kalaharituber pfeilii]